MNPIGIWEVIPYISKTNGKQMFSFNGGQFHLSMAQLKGKSIVMPLLLQGTIMQVEFFQPGEKLLNGDTVRDGARIVKQFAVEQDRELLREVAKDLLKEQVSVWSHMRPARAGVGQSNNDLAPNTQTGMQSAAAGTGEQVITRNAQLTNDGQPIPGANVAPDATTQANPEGVKQTTAAIFGQSAEQLTNEA